MTSTMDTKTQKFAAAVKARAKAEPGFKPLDIFLSSPENSTSSSRTEIIQITGNISGGLNVEPKPVTPGELTKLLDQPKSQPQWLLIQNLSPNVAKTLGDHLPLDPQFLLDHLHAVAVDSPGSDTKIQPKPWFRLREVESDLPILNSLRRHVNQIHVRFIGLRGFVEGSRISKNRKISKDHVRLDKRIYSEEDVSRLAGLYDPISRPDATFPPMALVRRVMSVWFKPNGTHGTTGLVLLDPPFKAKDEGQYGENQDSVDDKESYLATLVKDLNQTSALAEPAEHHHMLVLQCVLRIVTREWFKANTYIERDLNGIDWRLETEDTSTNEFRVFLTQLLVGRRRTCMYQALVDDQIELLRGRGMLPTDWGADDAPRILDEIRADFIQVQAKIERNSQRIAETFQIIGLFMAVRGGEQSTQQNLLLGFLTLIATLGVPFNAVAGILGMQTNYGPGQPDFVEFWRISTIVVGVIFGIGIILMVAAAFNLDRWVKCIVTGIFKFIFKKAKENLRARGRERSGQPTGTV